MKIEYTKSITKEFDIEIENIRNCYFKYLDSLGKTCYVGIYKNEEYIDNSLGRKRNAYIYIDIKKNGIDYERFNGLECGTFPLKCRVKNLFTYEKRVEKITKELFEKQRIKIINFLNKIF